MNMKKTKIMAVIMTLCMAASVTACGPFKLDLKPTETESEVTESQTEESATESETEASAKEEGWTCSKGHTGNTGKFCAECGEPQPDGSEETWTCSKGHSGNTGKFCSECGEPQEGPTEETTTETEAPETTAAETEAPETTAAETEAPETTAAETEAQSGNSGWVNFSDMHFYVNGKKYTLGKTTLQEMIDDGVPFDKNSIADAGNNINGNHISSNFKIKIDKYRSAMITVINDTKDNKKMSECYVNGISLYSIKDQKKEKVVTFDFGLDITQDDLIAACGKPEADNYKHFDADGKDFYTDKYTYKGERGKYFQISSYTFEFTNGEFSSISMSFYP